MRPFERCMMQPNAQRQGFDGRKGVGSSLLLLSATETHKASGTTDQYASVQSAFMAKLLHTCLGGPRDWHA